MANWLNEHLSFIIHPDKLDSFQTVFVFYLKLSLLTGTFLTLDPSLMLFTQITRRSGEQLFHHSMHKALNQIEWPYMLESVHIFGFDEKCISWVKIVYTCPMTSALTNGDKSNSFPLHCSVQQGCLLSPALFTFPLEPLALAIWSQSDIVVLNVKGVETLISLYADDLQNTKRSVPLLDLTSSFDNLSSYQLDKSDFKPL